jgi:hypothetical protein
MAGGMNIPNTIQDVYLDKSILVAQLEKNPKSELHRFALLFVIRYQSLACIYQSFSKDGIGKISYFVMA